jgi:hypothetical protein
LWRWRIVRGERIADVGRNGLGDDPAIPDTVHAAVERG